jgi:pyrimidine operon attenuation protein/uracil phosphoribosyltransferase
MSDNLTEDIVFKEYYAKRVNVMLNQAYAEGVSIGMSQMLGFVEIFEKAKIPVTTLGILQYIDEMNQKQREQKVKVSKIEKVEQDAVTTKDPIVATVNKKPKFEIVK